MSKVKADPTFRPNPAYDPLITYRGEFQHLVRSRRKDFPIPSKTFESRQAAEAYIRRHEERQFRRPDDYDQVVATQLEARKKPVTDLFARYRDDVSPRGKSTEFEVGRINAFIRHPVFAGVTVATMTPDVIARYIEHRREEDECADGTILRELHILQAIFSEARKPSWGFFDYFDPNPASARAHDKGTYPTDSPARTRRFEGDEEARLLRSCRGENNESGANRSPYLYAMVVLAIETAMRQGEIRTLEWQHVHLAGKHPTAFLPTSKTNKPRTVPLSPRAVEVLSDWERYQEPRIKRLARERKRRDISRPRYVFAILGDGEEEPVTANAVKIAYRKAVEKAKIEDLRFHDLRHEATSRLFEKYGFSQIQVMSITGHTTAVMTERYTHLSARLLSEKMRDHELATGKRFFELYLTARELIAIERIADKTAEHPSVVAERLVRKALTLK